MSEVFEKSIEKLHSIGTGRLKDLFLFGNELIVAKYDSLKKLDINDFKTVNSLAVKSSPFTQTGKYLIVATADSFLKVGLSDLKIH